MQWRCCGRRPHPALAALLVLCTAICQAQDFGTPLLASPPLQGGQGESPAPAPAPVPSPEPPAEPPLIPAPAAEPATPAVPAATPAGGNATEYFITIGEDGNFHNGCNTWYPTGWNQFEVVEAAAGVPKLYAASIPAGKTGPQLIRDLMDDAVASGLNFVRFFAFAVDPQYALQTAPGQFNEAVFRGLDYALEQARVRGLKAVLPFVNNWNDTGAADEMLRWNNIATPHEAFFSDPATRSTYRATVAAIIGRVNTINGRRYADDPTIFAWNLINEPRCYRCSDSLQSWVTEMAAYVKSLDTNHLLGIGEEGFYETGSPSFAANPLGLQSWAGTEGQDFLQNTRTPNIDFGTMHLWVDNWKDDSAAFPVTWIRQHIADATALGKPLVLEEFGKYADGRQALFGTVYSAVLASATGGSPLKGSAFWQWYDVGQMVPGGGLGEYGILNTDDIWGAITGQATSMNAYEGPGCDVDINECTRGTAGCAANAGCTNSNGSFTCACWYGYRGDGTSGCTATANLSALQRAFTAAGPGLLACDQGADIAITQGAPGFAYDPTGAFSDMGGIGTILPVSAQQCLIACQLAGANCTSASYNPTLQQCFLKSGTSADNCPAASVACTGNQTDSAGAACGDWTTYRRVSAPAAPPAVAPTVAPTLEAQPALQPAPATEFTTGAQTGPLLPTAGAALASPFAGVPPQVAAFDGPPGNGRRRLQGPQAVE